jgi:hypothetical protein
MRRVESSSRSERFLVYAHALSVITRFASIPWAAKRASARATKAVTVARALVDEELGVAEPGAVVDDRVCIVVADPGTLLCGGAAAVAGEGVAGPVEACVERDVHVQQVAGAGPFVAALRLARRPRRPREPVALQRLGDR